MKITTENLGKRFNRDWIFKNFNYTFEAGNIYAVVGPNGSGKSTLLQVLWGQMPPSAGSLNYSDDSRQIAVEDIFAHLSIATPYQELVEEFTLREMLEFHFRFKKPRGLLSNEAILERIELRHASDKLISNFSSGMKQRLKLGLAFYSDTTLLFLDEPTTNLDKKSFGWYQEQLLQLPPGQIIFMASNLESEYPSNAVKIDISAYK